MTGKCSSTKNQVYAIYGPDKQLYGMYNLLEFGALKYLVVIKSLTGKKAHCHV